MTSNARIIEKDIFADLVPAQAGDSEIIDLFGWQGGASRFSCQAIYDVSTPVAKTFASPHTAALVNQSLTYTSLAASLAANDITIALVDPGAPGASLSVVTVGDAITVNLATDGGGLITSTGNAVKAAINADPSASLLVLVSGTNASAVTALAATNLAGGLDGVIDITENTLGIPSHGFVTGLKTQLTTTGTLPAPLLTATDYYVIVVDANTIKLATSQANALAGTAINITNTGSVNATGTITPTALAGGQVAFYASATKEVWTLLRAATSISADGSVLFEEERATYRYFKAVKSLTAGVLDLKAYILVIGNNI